jgi:hypothetical protein
MKRLYLKPTTCNLKPTTFPDDKCQTFNQMVLAISRGINSLTDVLFSDKASKSYCFGVNSNSPATSATLAAP